MLLTSSHPEVFLSHINNSFLKNALAFNGNIKFNNYDLNKKKFFLSCFSDALTAQIIKYFNEDEDSVSLDEILIYSKDLVTILFNELGN